MNDDAATAAFDADRRLAGLALWVDQGARWVDQATAAARQLPPARGRGEEVRVVFDRRELDAFVAGLRGVARGLLGLAQPMPPPCLPAGLPPPRRRLRLVR
jgi:hypothetical protein